MDQVWQETAYRPQAVEKDIYRLWERHDLFRSAVDWEKRPFCIVMPPPNVTGRLHMGHAMEDVMQDGLIRWHRKKGYAVLWQPGVDHAGIATQAVVERRLLDEGLTREALGREKFLEKVWEWKDEYQAAIVGQLRRLGASPDWSRLRFTMDDEYSRVVRKVFVQLYREGLIYQGDYIVNWCPRCGTAVSDLEVSYEEEEGTLYRVRYPLVDESGQPRKEGPYIEVATTRPETILGDTAVAVHPEDPRYRDWVGKKVWVPVAGRAVPVIADEAVEMDFGTGAVKVTPFHDATDFAIGERHGLEKLQVIDEEGKMTDAAGPLKGLDRDEARKEMVRLLEEDGYLVKAEPYRHSVGHCSRCDAVIEPLVSRQWFVRTKPLAEKALRAVEEGQTVIHPERFTSVYRHWLENIRDWCISRQIWWGHRLPVWTCQDCGEVLVEEEDPEKCPKCGGSRLEQSPDVLDTWFSSALWPFATLGWPEDTDEMKFYYPTSVLVTGYDILFFWVARMMMMGIHFTGNVPFRTVYLHGLVRDSQGQKMSKSRGNTIDPMDLVESMGADALRWSLVVGIGPGSDVRVEPERLEGARNFINKIWNAARFSVPHLQGAPDGLPAKARLTLLDRWILHRLWETTRDVEELLGKFELGEALRILQIFFWEDFCDWYLEGIKPRLYGEDGESKGVAQAVLLHAWERILNLLHPWVPFITEYIWQQLPSREMPLMASPWPHRWGLEDEEALRRFQRVQEGLKAVRALRAELGLAPGLEIEIWAKGAQEGFLEDLRPYLFLARVRELKSVEGAIQVPVATAVAAGTQIFLPLEGLLDVEKERQRLQKRYDEVKAHFERITRRLQDREYREKAPVEVVLRDTQRQQELEATLKSLEERIRHLQP
ncbi:MAG: valine--tRNA ligase [Clostridiales bacterium]|nr:valine--tRNA ligase [Clostridiales bacterium]